MNPEVLKNALYAAWCIADTLGHQWGSLGWAAVAEAARRTKSLRAAARKIADLTHKYTTPGPLGYGCDSPCVARGGRAFCHTTATGRSEFEVLPGSPEEPAAQVHQWVMRPNRVIAVHAVWTVRAGEWPVCLTCDLFPAARRRHVEALIFRVGSYNVEGKEMGENDLMDMLAEREKWDIVQAAMALDKTLTDAGVRPAFSRWDESSTICLNIERQMAEQDDNEFAG